MGATVLVCVFDKSHDYVLLVRNKARKTIDEKFIAEKWRLPSGSIYKGKTDIQAAHRILKEKTGLRAAIHTKPVYEKEESGDHRIIVFEGEGVVERTCPTDPNILEADWVYWRLLLPDEHHYKMYKNCRVYEKHIHYINNSYEAVP